MELIIKEQKAIFLDICWIADTARAKKAQKNMPQARSPRHRRNI